MKPSTRQEKKQADIPPENISCPFLGLQDDAATWLAYPHPANYCHQAEPISNLSLAYQESTCLTSRHKSCPGYQHGWNGPLPGQYSGEPVNQLPRRRQLLQLAVLLVIVVVVLGWLANRQGWLGLGSNGSGGSQAELNASASQTASALLALGSDPSQTPTALPSATPDQALTQTARASLFTPTPPATPTATLSPTPDEPTPGPAFGTPFGPEQKYILHQLGTGESMGTLVSLYNTSNKVIEASNVLVTGASIWPGTVLVIVPGEKNPANVLRFKVILNDTGMSVSDLAEQYSVSVEDLRKYNSLGAGDEIPAGRYLIIPVS